MHGVPPESLCAGCAEYELSRVALAGRRTMTVAVPLVTIAALGAYSLYKLKVAQPALWVAAVAMTLISVGLVLAGFVSRLLARRKVMNERALSTVEREASERRFHEAVASTLRRAAS